MLLRQSRRRLIPTLSPYPSMVAFDVSGDGLVVVGEAFDNAAVIPGAKAFKWDRVNGTVEIPGVAAHDIHLAVAANYDGSVIAGRSINLSPNKRTAWRWTQATGTVVIGPLASAGILNAISDDGSVIAGDAFAWNPTDGFNALADPGGAGDWYALCVSGDGSLIGGTADGTAYPFGAPALWNPDGSFNSYIYPFPTGWQDDYTELTALSTDGTKALVVGFDEDYNNRSAIWDATTSTWAVLDSVGDYGVALSSNGVRALLLTSGYAIASVDGSRRLISNMGPSGTSSGMSRSGHVIGASRFNESFQWDAYKIDLPH